MKVSPDIEIDEVEEIISESIFPEIT